MVLDDCIGASYTKSLRLRSEAADAINVFKAAAENTAQNELREVMTDDHKCELSVHDMHEICEKGDIKLNRTVAYQLASNSITEGTIDVLTNTVCAMLYNVAVPKFLWAQAFSSAQYGMFTTKCLLQRSTHGRRMSVRGARWR